MVRLLIRFGSAGLLAGLLGCAPMVRLVFGYQNPKPETDASRLAYAQQLGMNPAQVALARPAFVLDHRRDTLLYPNPNVTGGVRFEGGKVQRLDTLPVDFALPSVLLFDAQGRGLRLSPDNRCEPGKYSIIKPAVAQLNEPLRIDARKYNADFDAVAAGFTTADGQPLRFEQVQDGSRLYVGLFGIKYWDRETRKQLALVQSELRKLPPGQARLLYFNCDLSPEAWAEMQQRERQRKGRPQ
ncbi:hypothetical protein [Hymenobacter edaphi]|uniref:Lipoprotein n=1 Tax=Hymenobacter edaphi TaxID=2211146 RepID=A0A328BTG3_9BACT|nr:hypothetical protein [Hymenobacter edaphi]RAK69965.1 hypothetical protein DLM85_03680 [Hymenobacter edaphi]